MPAKPRVFLLDAAPVIRLHELELWDEVVQRATLIIPGVVARVETRFADVSGVIRPIHIRRDADAGRLQIKEAEAVDVEALARLFDDSIRDEVHAGEREALALLRRWDGPRPLFCTTDRHATVALCLLGLSESGVSFERFLRLIGLGREVSPWWYSDAVFRQWIEEGRRRRLTGEGLA